jgi:hypothetical protein
MYKKNIRNTYAKNMTPELCGIIFVVDLKY